MVSNETNQSISFANIGVVGKDIGTVSNDSGYFKIKLPAQFDNDTVRISCIGFKTQNYRVVDFKNTILKTHLIKLERLSYNLPEIAISNKKFKDLGYLSKGGFAGNFGYENTLGYELGNLITLKETGCILKTANIHVLKSSYKHLFFRVNVYKMLDDSSFVNILREPIYYSGNGTFSKEKTIKIDLSKYKIYVHSNFLVSIEMVKDLGKGQIDFIFNPSKLFVFP